MKVTQNREGYGDWKHIDVRVGFSVPEDDPEWIVLRVNGDPDKELLFSENEARELLDCLERGLDEF